MTPLLVPGRTRSGLCWDVPIGIVAVNVLGFHRAGNIRILMVTSPQPLIAAPDIPTAAQADFPGLTYESFYGLLAPARTSKPIIEQIAKATHAPQATGPGLRDEGESWLAAPRRLCRAEGQSSERPPSFVSDLHAHDLDHLIATLLLLSTSSPRLPTAVAGPLCSRSASRFRFSVAWSAPGSLPHIEQEERGDKVIEIVRVKITDEGRRAL